MSTLDGVLKLLDKWPTWRGIKESPARIKDLELRVADLEGRLRRAPGEACPKCGALSFRVESSSPSGHMGDLGVIDRVYACQEPDCDFREKRVVTPGR